MTPRETQIAVSTESPTDPIRRAISRIRARAEERSRRLRLLGSMWTAGGTDEEATIATLRAELGGLAQELRGVGWQSFASVVQDAADVLAGWHETRDLKAPVHAGRRILILDDSEVTRDIIALALERTGCEVTVAATTKEYSVRVQEFSPEVLLVEPAHPQLGAERAWTTLRARIKNPVVPVILFSSAPIDQLAVWADRAGADGFLTKDQGTDELVEHLEEVLSQVLW